MPSDSNTHIHLFLYRDSDRWGHENRQQTLQIPLGPRHFVQSLKTIQCALVNHCGGNTFKCLFNIDRFFCAGLKIWYSTLRLTERHSLFIGNSPPAIVYINLVTKDNLALVSLEQSMRKASHKWKTLGITRTSLYQELISPAIECLKTFCVVHVVDKHAAVCASIECNT